MTENEIFTRALNLGTGWEVYNVTFNLENKELRVYIRIEGNQRHNGGD
jgi:hypothetical protein